jgi:hypothetical protein
VPVTSDILFPGHDTTWSTDRAYRYFLRRPASLLEQAKPVIAFILLNPSTADETKDDPTVAKCRRYAAGWGFGEVIVLNAFAFRATDPKNMRAHIDPVGPDNDRTILETAQAVHGLGGTLLCGWGTHGAHLERSAQVQALLEPFPLKAFTLTKHGEPGHPLYLRGDLQPMQWKP